MKKGQVILSAAAFIVTAFSTFAFKTAHKFAGSQLKGTSKSPIVSCSLVTCWTLSTGVKGVCHTLSATSPKAVTTLYTGANNCANKLGAGIKYTKTSD